MLRILIVEDEFLIAWNAESVLQEAGFEVSGIAPTFERALSLAEQTRPDLVLMDIVLASPRDGVEAAVEIRERFGIPTVFTSANPDDANRERAQAAEPAGWMPKPYSSERLLQTIWAVSRSASCHGDGSEVFRSEIGPAGGACLDDPASEEPSRSPDVK